MVRRWRNSPQISQFMLNQHEISPEEQISWFNKIKNDEKQAQFVLYYKEQPIGAGNLKNSGNKLYNAKTAESGYYIASEKYRGTFVAFLPALLMHEYAFTELKIKKLIANVKIDNSAAIRFNETLGYIKSDFENSNSNNLVSMQLSPESHQKSFEKLHNFSLR